MKHKLIISDKNNKTVFETKQKEIKNDAELKKILKKYTE
jgi:hypothetical protein